MSDGATQDIELLEPYPTAQAEIFKRQALQMMKGRMCWPGSLDHLEKGPYELFHATNKFGDKFPVLVYRATIEQYTEMERELKDNHYLHNHAFPEICEAYDAILPNDYRLRFIAMDLCADESLPAVQVPQCLRSILRLPS